MPTPRKSNGHKSRRTARVVAAPLPDHQAIAARAFEIFQERGGAHGRDFDDWLAAERELQPRPPAGGRRSSRRLSL